MSTKIRLKKQKPPLSIFKQLLCYSIFSFFLAIGLILLSGKKLENVIISYATIETERVATTILNQVTRNNITIPSNLYTVTKDKNDTITLLDINTQKSNALLSKINEEMMQKIMQLEEGNTKDLQISNSLKGTKLTYLKDGVVCEIPLGVLLGNSLLVNTSAVVPIRFSFIGYVKSHLKTKVTPYGLNNALVEIALEVSLTEQITMPHTTKSIKVTTDISLLVELVQGSVPNFYQGTYQEADSLSLPFR